MQWPFIETAQITQRFGDTRRRGRHGAWDVAAPRGSAIKAPEDGNLYMFTLRRVGYKIPLSETGDWIPKATQVLPRPLRAYSWYFADRYGTIVVLQNDQRWWMFAHTEPMAWWTMATKHGMNYEFRHGGGVPPDWKIECHYTDVPVHVREGDVIAALGNSGISTGPHTHFEICKPGYAGGAYGRLDPAEFFSDK